MPAWGGSLTHLKVPAWVHSEWMELELAQRKAILASQVKKWPKATKQEKSEILDAICQVTGWHRDHARKMIRQQAAGQERAAQRRPREPVLTYGPDVVALLVRCWALLDGSTGKRLQGPSSSTTTCRNGAPCTRSPTPGAARLVPTTRPTSSRRTGPWSGAVSATTVTTPHESWTC